MEEQLRLVHLQDELEFRRQIGNREQKRINITITKSSPKKLPLRPTTVRSDIPANKSAFHTFRSYDERNAQSDSGKENIEQIKYNDKKLYKFFTNSARDASNFKNIRYTNYFDFEELSDNDILPNSMSSSYNTYPTKRRTNAAHNNNQCQISTKHRPMCNFCKEKRFLARNQDENFEKDLLYCNSCQNEPFCLNCRREICVHCKRPTNHKTHEKHLNQKIKKHEIKLPGWKHYNAITTKNKVSPNYKESFRILDTDDDDDSESNSSSRPPYSFNIKETSIFHPSNTLFNHELSFDTIPKRVTSNSTTSFDELKRITDEKLLKYAKNYGEFRTKKAINENKTQNVDSFPLPLMREDTQQSLSGLNEELNKDDNTNAFKRIQTKWQVNLNR